MLSGTLHPSLAWLAARPWAGLAVSIVLAGIASIALRQDSNWDLQNYHYYNAWAFVHGRFGLDWAPAQLQSFYSPFLDLPFYALVAADVPPRVICVRARDPDRRCVVLLRAHRGAAVRAAARDDAAAGDPRGGRDRRHGADVGEPHRHSP